MSKLLAAVRKEAGKPTYLGELHEALGMTYEALDEELKALAEQGLVEWYGRAPTSIGYGEIRPDVYAVRALGGSMVWEKEPSCYTCGNQRLCKLWHDLQKLRNDHLPMLNTENGEEPNCVEVVASMARACKEYAEVAQ